MSLVNARQFHHGNYVLTGIPLDPDGHRYEYWMSNTGHNDAYKCGVFQDNDHIETRITEFIKFYEENHERLRDAKHREFMVQTPLGNLRVYAKQETVPDQPDNFPGVYIDLNATDELLTCVEYESINQKLQTTAFQPGCDTPVFLLEHQLTEDEDLDSDDDETNR